MKVIPNEVSMRQASIFELRTLARNMGVNSPTTLKKEQLIERILKIVNGEEKPSLPKSRAGRPPKTGLVQMQKNSVCDYFVLLKNHN